MSREPGSKLTYANIASTLALFIAVGGGTAFAVVAANQVDSASIIDREVKKPDLAPAAVTKVKLHDNAVNSAKVLDNALTGADVNEAELNGLQRGMTVQAHKLLRSEGGVLKPTHKPIVVLPGLGTVEGTCSQPVGFPQLLGATWFHNGSGIKLANFSFRGVSEYGLSQNSPPTVLQTGDIPAGESSKELLYTSADAQTLRAVTGTTLIAERRPTQDQRFGMAIIHSALLLSRNSSSCRFWIEASVY